MAPKRTPGTREMLYIIAGRLTLEVDEQRSQAETGEAGDRFRAVPARVSYA